MLLWATKAQFSTGPNWASLSFFFLFVYFCLTAAQRKLSRRFFFLKDFGPLMCIIDEKLFRGDCHV